MSRALPIAERSALDFYATPQALASAICLRIAKVLSPGLVVEPSAGCGPFVRAARNTWPNARVVAVDVDEGKSKVLEAAGAHFIILEDWKLVAAHDIIVAIAERASPVLVVGNPPYREAEEHIQAALSWMSPGDELFFLLRINFLGSRSRLAFWAGTPLVEMMPVVPRPSFTVRGADATEYAVFRWKSGHQGPARISPPIMWDKRR